MADPYRFPGVQRDLSQQSIEQQLQLAYERGLTDGKRLGAAEGKQQAQQTAQQQAQAEAGEQLKQAVRALRQQFEQQLTQLQQQLAGQQQQQEQQLALGVFELVSQLAQSTLEAELSLQPAHLQQAVNSLLPLLQVNEHISAVRLAPQDWAVWQQLDVTALGEVQLQADHSLAPGSAAFVGTAQLHLVDFRQRLAAMLPQVQQQLQAADDVSA
ncbi:FliH/SctL family protein [Rheinheimera sp. NSM]|uniref:FliH/SctL family protein n=1 Tax=Rheinheimera sp. NSM TaxID=3457884 RepID=UPI004036A618